jgi:hypothetical protein
VWIGESWATQDGRGTQEITEIGSSFPVYRRSFSTAPGATPVFTAWVGDGVWFDHSPNWPNCPIGTVFHARHMRVGNTVTVQERCSIAAPFVGTWYFGVPNGWIPASGINYDIPLGQVNAYRAGAGWFTGWLAYHTLYTGAVPDIAWLSAAGVGPAGTPISIDAWTGSFPGAWAVNEVAGLSYSFEIAP